MAMNQGNVGCSSAGRLHALGLAEMAAGLVVAAPRPDEPNQPYTVQLTPLALRDWKFLAAARIPGAPMQLHQMLDEGLNRLRAGQWVERDFSPIGSTGLVFSQRRLRWVLSQDSAYRRLVILAIAQAGLDPLRKIWRYFDQLKAVDLLQTGELYLRRLDLLTDQFEGRPTRSMEKGYTTALVSVFGEAPAAFLRTYDQTRRAIFVCCWHKAKEESPRMWSDYCGDGGGFALQSTERQLQHQFVQMLEGRQGLHFRDVAYVDHLTHDPASHGIPEQAFLKARHFAHEQEIRFAWLLAEALAGTETEIGVLLAGLPKYRRLPFDLTAATEHIVLNPLGQADQHAELLTLLAGRWSGLAEKVVSSRWVGP